MYRRRGMRYEVSGIRYEVSGIGYELFNPKTIQQFHQINAHHFRHN